MNIPIQSLKPALLLLAACGGVGLAIANPTPNLQDVPAGHWARAAADKLVQFGVLSAPNGKFRGGDNLTRDELTTALAALARSIEQRKWDGAELKGAVGHTEAPGWKMQVVTRYDAAVVFARMAGYASRGLPRKTPSEPGTSVIIPPKTRVPAALAKGPVSADLNYLVSKRMAGPTSPLLRTTTAKITGDDLARAVTEMVVGLTDQWTDEPQNKEPIAPRPGGRA